MPKSEIWNSWQVIPQNAIERKMTTIEPCRAKLMQKFYLKIHQFDSMHLSDLLAVLSFFGLFWWHLKSPELSWEILVYPHQPKRSYILTPAVSPPKSHYDIHLLVDPLRSLAVCLALWVSVFSPMPLQVLRLQQPSGHWNGQHGSAPQRVLWSPDRSCRSCFHLRCPMLLPL